MSRSLSEYWRKVRHTKEGWIHPDDADLFNHESHSFNLDFPPPAFIGDIENAKIIILVANGGYKPDVTPFEFGAKDSEAKYLKRIEYPSAANWAEAAPYYQNVNYAKLLFSGKAAVVNACAYRSPQISLEPENKRLVKKLPSVQFNRTWLVQTIFPQTDSGKRLIVGKRHGLWGLPASVKRSCGYIADPAPVSPHLSKVVWDSITRFLQNGV